MADIAADNLNGQVNASLGYIITQTNVHMLLGVCRAQCLESWVDEWCWS